MADKLTIARPYARAAFEEASSENRLTQWSDSLQVAAQVVQDPRVASLIGHPQVTPEQLAQLLIDIAGPSLGEHGANFVRTLAANHRLTYLPEVLAQFEVLKDEAQGVADVTVTSASNLDESQKQKLSAALEKRLRRKVRLHAEVDPDLIGGAVLRSGDLVIDGSLSSRLERIAYELTA
ncbi:MAG TPA: F0F1 ATP synthase subunit delta [Steroidobacteraceae bacterium]|nr:F0F1 ATP synthase subunit delta [Steroidobacteraceae bacterium]